MFCCQLLTFGTRENEKEKCKKKKWEEKLYQRKKVQLQIMRNAYFIECLIIKIVVAAAVLVTVVAAVVMIIL